jgi:hypothetical protein
MKGQGGTLTLDDQIVPFLAALSDDHFYGVVTLTYHNGIIKEVDVHEKYRLAEQVRRAVKRLLLGS